MQIEILKQPLYGTVYWDAEKFVFTENPGFSGSDYYIYQKTTQDFAAIYVNYYNTFNLPPTASSISLTAKAFHSTVLDLNDIVYDNTKPFGDLFIKKIWGNQHGSVELSGSKIVYNAGFFNDVDSLSFIASDKQFDITSSVTLSVVGGYNRGFDFSKVPQTVIREANRIMPVYRTKYPNWNSMYYTMTSISAKWYTMDHDVDRWERTLTKVRSSSAVWNLAYSKKNKYDGGFGIVLSSYQDWDARFKFLSTNTIATLSSTYAKWNTMYTLACTYSSKFTDYYIKDFKSVYTTVSSNSANWNSCSAVDMDKIGIDPLYRDDKWIELDSLAAFVEKNRMLFLTGKEISYNFLNEKNTSNRVASLVIPYDMTILGWELISTIPTESQVSILSSDYDTYPNVVSILSTSKPTLDMSNPLKNQDNDLSGKWTVDLMANTILTFILDTNTSISPSILISLKANKSK